jgi:hypothetical protein
MKSVSKGISTYIGMAIAILALIPPTVDQIVSYVENNSTSFTTGDKTMAISGAAVFAVTALGRFAQAVAKIVKGES